MKLNKFSILVVFALLSACTGNNIRNYDDYINWLANKENGLLLTKTIGGLDLTASYLPSDFLVYQDIEVDDMNKPGRIDSLKDLYKKGITIKLSFTPHDKDEPGDLMYSNVQNYGEYRDKILNITFDIERLIKLKTGNKEYKPVLTSFEDTYGLKPGRDVICVFVPANKNEDEFYRSEKLDFVFTDEIFNSGINHFVFNRKAINNSESIEFISQILNNHDQ